MDATIINTVDKSETHYYDKDWISAQEILCFFLINRTSTSAVFICSVTLFVLCYSMILPFVRWCNTTDINTNIGNGLQKDDPILLIVPCFLQLVLAKHLARSGLKPIVVAPQLF